MLTLTDLVRNGLNKLRRAIEPFEFGHELPVKPASHRRILLQHIALLVWVGLPIK